MSVIIVNYYYRVTLCCWVLLLKIIEYMMAAFDNNMEIDTTLNFF